MAIIVNTTQLLLLNFARGVRAKNCTKSRLHFSCCSLFRTFGFGACFFLSLTLTEKKKVESESLGLLKTFCLLKAMTMKDFRHDHHLLLLFLSPLLPAPFTEYCLQITLVNSEVFLCHTWVMVSKILICLLAFSGVIQSILPACFVSSFTLLCGLSLSHGSWWCILVLILYEHYYQF